MQGSPAGRAPAILLALLLAVFWARQLAPITGQSHTLDEAAEIGAGYVELKQAFYGYNAGHPPLILMLHGLAVAPLHPRFAVDLRPSRAFELHQAWYDAGNQFLYAANRSPLAALALARISTVALVTLLVVVAFVWSRRMFGGWGGALTAFLLTFDPNLLAHGGLATTDAGIAALMLLAMYCIWRYLAGGPSGHPEGGLKGHPKGGSAWWVGAMGLSFGAACAGKINGLLLFPMLAAAMLLVEVGSEARPPFSGRALGKRLLLMIEVVAIVAAIAWLVIWALYRFQVGTLAETARYDPTIVGLVQRGFPAALAEWRLPAPWYWWCLAFQHLRPLSLGPFLWGNKFSEPTWLYAPATFLLKTPLPGLALLALGGLLAGRLRWRDGVMVYGGALLLAGAAAAVPTSPGYRHLLPAMPLAAIALGGYARPRRFPRWTKVFVSAMLAWLAVESLSVSPHYLAYFNEIAGGPRGGYRYLVDSDLDWGQDLPGLARYLQENRIETVYLDYFGTAPPQAYGVAGVRPLSSAREPLWRPGEDPTRVVIAISATQLQCTGPDWPFSRAPAPYTWLNNREPIATIGHSIFIYRLRGA